MTWYIASFVAGAVTYAYGVPLVVAGATAIKNWITAKTGV